MTYSEIKQQGYFNTVEKKDKYTMHDVKKLIKANKNLTEPIAVSIIKCVAKHNSSELSDAFFSYNSSTNISKRMNLMQ